MQFVIILKCNNNFITFHYTILQWRRLFAVGSTEFYSKQNFISSMKKNSTLTLGSFDLKKFILGSATKKGPASFIKIFYHKCLVDLNSLKSSPG